MDRLLQSPKTLTEISYYLQQYRTQKDIDTVFDKKWQKKREERKLYIKEICTNYKHFTLKKTRKKKYIKKEGTKTYDNATLASHQYTLDI